MKPPIEYRPIRSPNFGRALNPDTNTEAASPTARTKPLFIDGDLVFKPAFDRTAYQRDYMRKRRAVKRDNAKG